MKKRFFALVTAAVILLSIILPVSAAEYKNFTVSDDMKTIFDGETTYEMIELPDGYFTDSHYSYNFYYSVCVPGYYSYADIYAISKDLDILKIEFYDEKGNKTGLLYAKSATKADIEEFISGKSSFYKIRSNYSSEVYSKIDASIVGEIEAYVAENSDKAETVEVAKLIDNDFATNSFTLQAYSKNYIVAREYGGVYRVNGEWCYVGFDDLENNHFNDSGYFSYRKGSVTLTKLDEALGEKLTEAALSANYLPYSYDSEYQYVDEEFFNLGSYEDSVAARVFFWIVFVFLGFIIPAVPMIFGLVLPNTKKRHTKKWYIVAAFSLLWILTAAVIMLILIL